MDMIASRLLLKDIMKAAVSAAPIATPLAAAFVGLTVTAAVPGQDLTQDQLTEPDFAGYARIPLVAANWSAPTMNEDGSCTVLNSTPVKFQMTDDLAPATVLGVFLSDALSAGNLLAYSPFDASLTLVQSDQAIHITPQVSLGPDLDLGDSCVRA